MNIKQVITTLSVSMLMCGMAHATTWYVAANGGSDGNTGRTEETAFATIQKAYAVASSGDEIIVGDGEYSGFGTGYRDKCAYITVKSKNGYSRTMLKGSLILGWNEFYQYVTVSGFTITNVNVIAEGGMLRNCRIVGCSGKESCHAIYNSIFEDSIFSTSETHFYNCTFYKNTISPYAGSFNNCVFYQCSASGSSSANCVQYDSTAFGIAVNPMFVNVCGRNFKLREGSPCIDAGNNSYASGDYDIGGNARIYNGTVDIGAYEWRPVIPAGIENIVALQCYPWNGLVDLSFTVTGEAGEKYDISFTAKDVVGGTTLTMATLLDAKRAAVSVSDPISPGTYRWAWNAAADLPDGFTCDRVIVTGTVEEHLGGVQLWENGPYWAECNVGATNPEDAGYYFWWGDTVGYKRNGANDGWVSVKDGTAFTFEDGNCMTYGKYKSTLQAEGYIDSKGNLVAVYDAATAHHGAPWRMPTDAEFSDLINKCTTTWTTRNGVSGRLVTGKETYASKSIFLPVAGYGDESYLYIADTYGFYWSSTAYSNHQWAWFLDFGLNPWVVDWFALSFNHRYIAKSIRPVRASTK